MNKIDKKFGGIKLFIGVLLALIMTISMNPLIEIPGDEESEPYDNSINDILWVEEDTAMPNVDTDARTSMDIMPAETFIANPVFKGYFKLLDEYGLPLADAPWELREGFYQQGYNGYDPVNITYGEVVASGVSDSDGYITIDSSGNIPFDEGYVCTYLLIKFPENTVELSAEGLRKDSNDDPLTIQNAAYLTFQSTRYHPFQHDGYILVGRSATISSFTSNTAATTYGVYPDAPFVIGVIGEFSIIEKYESIDTGGTLQPEITTTKLTAGNFSSTPSETITSGDSSYSWQGYYLDDETVLRTDYPVLIEGIYDNHTIRHQYAGQYTLSFNTNGGLPVPLNQTLGFGVKATAPAPPTKPGFDFVGWYKDNGTFSQKWDFNTNLMPADNLTLYAKWENAAYTMTVEYMTRDGMPLDSATNHIAIQGSSFTAANPGFTNYMLVDWKLDGGPLQGSTNPVISPVTGPASITLIYGQDKGGSGGTIPDGIEDITITKKFQSSTGASLLEDQTVYVNIGETFADIHDFVTGYTYQGYKIDSGLLNDNAEPSITPVVGDSDKTVIYIYGINNNTVTVEYVDRAGSNIEIATSFSKTYNEIFNITAPAIDGYIFVDWRQDGGPLKGNTNPGSFTMGSVGTTITLVYGQDKGGNGGTIPDGIEDITITKKFESTTGTALRTDQTVYVNIGHTFDDGADAIDGWIYSHFNVGGIDSVQYAVPSITLSSGDSGITVTYVYIRAYMITVKYETQFGVQIMADTTHIVPHGSSFSAVDHAFSDYTLTEWKLDSVLQGNTNPVINPVTGTVTITLVYSPIDSNPDTEYFTVTEKHLNTMGSKLRADVIKYIAINTSYTGDHDAELSGYTYKGYKLNGGAQANSPQKPNIENVLENQEVLFIYGLNQYLIHVTNQDENGSSLTGNQDVYVEYGQNFTADISVFLNKALINWKMDGIIQNNTSPRLKNVISNHDLVLIYGSNGKGGGNGGGSGSGNNWGSKPIDKTLDSKDEEIIPSLIADDHIKYISGYPDGTVRIDQAITRAEAASIFFILLKDDTKYSDTSILFHDVDNTGWYSQAVNYLAEIGVISGYPDGTFRPNETITRAEYATMTSRFSQLEKTTSNFFSDVQDSHWARNYINSVYAKGWAVGYGDNTFRPAGKITRAEVVVMTNKVLGRKANHKMIEASLESDVIFIDLNSKHWSYYDVMEASVEHVFIHDNMGNEIWTKAIQ